ncbi:MAG TPA: 4-hydroxy-2-oxoheptanedioate aldolase [Burkholderiaceae bacterium]|nr:4-hydroxy-2-oxoheptanedioate aldolase [Burkholderiaceae bacterium]
MDITNPFKRALREGRPQIGLWASLADPLVAEALATTGFDWLLIDGEHAPNDLRSILAQLQAVASGSVGAPKPTHAIVRPPIGDVVVIKQLLEIGAQTLLIPMVDSAEQAARMVAATRYPPRGVRGVGSSGARSSRWSGVPNYLKRADDEMCVLVQVETLTGLSNLAEIAAVDGVDGVFFGPADLSASMGFLGNPAHPDVVAALTGGVKTVRAAGKAPGILMTDNRASQHYLDQGALFVAVGVDAMLLVQAAKTLAASFTGAAAGAAPPPSSYA